MTGADAIIKCLEDEGVTTVFGYPGVAICPFYNSILSSPIETILIRTEQNAAHAASGFARVTGQVGVCAVTSGPGATNVITGIATAFADSIPLVCITGQVNSELIGSGEVSLLNMDAESVCAYLGISCYDMLFRASYDEVHIWKHVLDESQISSMYTAYIAA